MFVWANNLCKIRRISGTLFKVNCCGSWCGYYSRGEGKELFDALQSFVFDKVSNFNRFLKHSWNILNCNWLFKKDFEIITYRCLKIAQCFLGWNGCYPFCILMFSTLKIDPVTCGICHNFHRSLVSLMKCYSRSPVFMTTHEKSYANALIFCLRGEYDDTWSGGFFFTLLLTKKMDQLSSFAHVSTDAALMCW